MIRSRIFRLTVMVLTLSGSSLLGACGAGSEGKGVVRDFLKANLPNPEYDLIDVSGLDSTQHVMPATIAQMRKLSAAKFKAGTSFVAPTAQLKYLRVTYAQDKDTVCQTFYLDQNLTGVVCVKTDVR